MAKIIRYINHAYPKFAEYLSTHSMYEAQKKFSHIMPTIRADVSAYATSVGVTIPDDFRVR